MSVKIVAVRQDTAYTSSDFSQHVVEVSPQRILYTVLAYHGAPTGELFELPLPWTYVLVTVGYGRVYPSGIAGSHAPMTKPSRRDLMGIPPLLGLNDVGTFCAGHFPRIRPTGYGHSPNEVILEATIVALSSAGVGEYPYTSLLGQLRSFKALQRLAGETTLSATYTYWESLPEFPKEIPLQDADLWYGRSFWKWLESPAVLVD